MALPRPPSLVVLLLLRIGTVEPATTSPEGPREMGVPWRVRAGLPGVRVVPDTSMAEGWRVNVSEAMTVVLDGEAPVGRG